MPNGMPIDPQHSHADKAVREAALMLVRLIALQAVREGSASLIEVSQDVQIPEDRP